MHRTAAGVAFALLLNTGLAREAHAQKQASPPTVVVAPFVTSTTGEEYQWIGSAFSEALTDRLLSSDDANVFSQKQWAAVLRERDIAARTVSSEADAEAIARQLGADQYVFGRFKAGWPEVTVSARRYKVGSDEAIAEVSVTGNLSELIKVEKDVAKGIFGKDFKKAAKASGPAKNVSAWRSLTLCRDALALQSIGPRAKIWLPTSLAEQALGHCERALKEDKKNAIAQAFSALGQYIVGQKKPALQTIGKVLKSKKRPYGWVDQIAFFLYLQEKDDKKASKAITTAIKKRPGLLHARTTLGEHLIASGDLAGAQKVLEDSLAASPNQPWVLVQVGKLKAQQGDVDGAITSTDQALALVPDDAVVLMEKASRLIDGKRYQDAEAVLRAAMAADPRLASAYLRLGYVYLETNQLELAGPILNKALYEADRESERRVKGYAHYDLAKLHARLGDPERAAAELGRALAAGFSERERFEADKDLVEVRKLPAYKALFPADKASAAKAGDAAGERKGGDAPADAKATEPKATEPKATEPKATEPKATEPKGSEPAKGRP
jgi:tetratricopeptide (TPR) repeat protein